MRIVHALLALAALFAVEPAAAQTYGRGYPVCLHVYGPVTYYDCGYSSIAQCNASASGRAAQCEPNPYAAQAAIPRPSKRARPVY
ncbi:MAG: DUF3551 domain-containing protein [Bradyrhizobium sp.]|nr:DUF3551 domain-containing protein [Bradyrhizobium sp.]